MIHGVAAAAAYQRAHQILTAPRPVDQQARSEVQELQARLERHNLIIQTLLMILLEKKVLHEDEFREWMAYVDQLDGVKDGKLREDRSPATCPSCGRNSPRSAVKCQYCGHELEADFLARRPAPADPQP